MSVVAAWNGEIGSDSMGFCETTGIWMPQQKLFVRNREIVLGTCGNSVSFSDISFILAYLADVIWLLEHTGKNMVRGREDNTAFSDFIEGLQDYSIILMSKKGRYIVQEKGVQRFTNDVPITIGTGGHVASTALLLGLKMHAAIETAIHIGENVRGEPRVVKAKELLTIRRPKTRMERMLKVVEVA